MCTNFYDYIWCKINIMIEEIGAGTAPFNGAIWEEFSETTSASALKKLSLMSNFHLLGANKVHI